jgi:lysophospholipase L1-like esterase
MTTTPRRRTVATLALLPALIAGSIAAATIGAPAPATADTGTPIRMVVAGDSVSAAPQSWLHQLDDPAITYAGGYQHAGYDSGQVLTAIPAGLDADVLVIMLGTNDVNHRLPAWQMAHNIETLAVKVRAAHVLLAFLPPSDITDDHITHVNRQNKGIAYNRTLVALAAKHGWLYADPFADYRAVSNAWGLHGSDDGVHPTATTAAVIANRMALYVKQADLAAAGSGTGR